MLKTKKEEDGSADLTAQVTVITLFSLSPRGSQELKVLFFHYEGEWKDRACGETHT